MAPSVLSSVLATLGANVASAESDADLLSRYVANRDDAAFAALVRRYARLVWRVARTRCRTAATAEDVFQATFVVLARKAASVRSGGALPGWLHRTAHRLAVKAARGERPAAPLPADAPVSADPLDALTARELLAAVDDEVARLSDAERSAVVLCGVEDQSVDEAAGRLGWTPASVKGRLRRARAKLRARLAARGLTLPAVALGLVGGPTAAAVQAAARAATGGPVRPAVTPLIAEGLSMNGAITKAVVGVTLLGGLMLAGGWGGRTGPNPQATAAPVPKAAPSEGGLLWTFHCKTGELTAYTPAGVKAKTLTLRDGYRLRGMTPDGSKLVFVGRGGRLADAADLKPGLSVHLRDISESTEGVDTGIAYTHQDQFVWSPDGKKVVRVGFPRGRLPQGLPLVTNSVIDLETKTETPIPLGDDHEQVLNWSPDGTWLFTTRYTKTVQHGKVTYFQTEKRRYDLKANTSRPVDTKWQLGPVALSPDGRSLFGCGTEPDTVGPDMRHLMVRADVATGKSAEVARHEDQSFASPHWSPGGTRVAYLWHKRADKGEAFLAITDPDGKNATTVIIPTPGDTANEVAFFGWFPDKPAAKPPAAERKDGSNRPGEAAEEYTWNDAKRTRAVRTLVLGGEKVEFVRVPKGSFTMGSPESDQEAEGNERPPHRVTFTKDLWVAKHPVTKGQFAAFVTATGYKTDAEADGKGGEGFNGRAMRAGANFHWQETGWEQTDAHPVVNVTWTDAAKFCEWAAKEAKVPVRLPTEAEYEYAARGGTPTRFLAGDEAASLDGYANVADASAKGKLGMAWAVPFDDGEAFTSPVGKYKANGFGLHDMTGNVWSWCGDWADAAVYRRGDVTDPEANVNGAKKNRVLRGGSWHDPAKNCRAAARSWAAPDARLYNIGFRLVFSPDVPPGGDGRNRDEPKKEAKKPDEPAWKAAFRTAYGLKDGELVRRVAPPYPDCRTDYFRDRFERSRKRLPTVRELDDEVNNFTQFNWKDGAASAGWQTHTEPERGVSLQFVLDTVLEIPRTRLESDQTTLDQKVTGDFVVRVGADREKMAVQLEAVLRTELELPVKFSFTDAEEDVFVLSGKYEAKPLEDRKANQIEVYAVHLTDRNRGGGGGGTFKEMTDAVERHVGRPVILDKIEGEPRNVHWHYNYRDQNDPIKYAQDTHPPTVLDNLAAQTGLTVKEEKRKVRKLVVEFAELKK